MTRIIMIGFATAGLLLGMYINAALSQEKTYDLKVSASDLNVLAQALNELPKKVADPLFAKLQAQVAEQEKKNTEEKK